MTLEEVKKILKTTGLPVIYRAWPVNGAPSPPFICYLVKYSNNLFADGGVYHKVDYVQVELYTKLKDLVSEGKVESALSSFHWEKTEEYIDTEKCYEIIYEIEV